MPFILLLVCFIATACSSKENWKYTQLEGTHTARLSYSTQNEPFLEIFKIEDKYHGYLYIPHIQKKQKEIPLHLHIKDEQLTYLAIEHKGGHKLLLSEEVIEKILSALSEQNIVSIETLGYKSTLNPSGFEQAHKKLQKPFSRIFRLL
jgi:hypothetical protein